LRRLGQRQSAFALIVANSLDEPRPIPWMQDMSLAAARRVTRKLCAAARQLRTRPVHCRALGADAARAPPVEGSEAASASG